MKEQLISFATAKLAKEKGFDIPCQWAFGKNGEEPINFNEYHYEFSKDKLIHGDNFNFYKGVYRNISAPTQSLLQKWLREEHNIHVNVSYGLTFTFKISGDLKGNDYVQYDDKEEYWGRTYEESLEKGLQEALKLI